jgi:hypothetical protein
MAALDELIGKADRLLDEHDYAGARLLYRQAAVLASPTPQLLFNLRVAEGQDQLTFSEQLGKLYPDSIIVQRSIVADLMRLGGHWNVSAVRKCNELLDQNRKFSEELAIRGLRFRAASRTRSLAARDPYETLVEDFLALWAVGETHAWAIRSRIRLLEELGRIVEPATIPVMEALVAEQRLPSEIRRFLGAKLDELRLLRQATEAITKESEEKMPVETHVAFIDFREVDP